jgi:hypothetical protein
VAAGGHVSDQVAAPNGGSGSCPRSLGVIVFLAVDPEPVSPGSAGRQEERSLTWFTGRRQQRRPRRYVLTWFKIAGLGLVSVVDLGFRRVDGANVRTKTKRPP